jgi:16S rRNA (guanine(966)-N(2))-methyltransferase RsmD
MKPSQKQKSLRPTANKVIEAIFNILRSQVNNASFLDLYAGTGAVGIEAIRHGASNAVFVEASKSASKDIVKIATKLRIAEKTRVITKKAISFIENAEMNNMTFNIIFLDPPYHTDEIMHILSAIDKSTILEHNGILIAEHFNKKQLPDRFDRLHKIKDYKYGDTVLSFYEST